MKDGQTTIKTENNWTSNMLYVLYILFLVLGLAIIGKVVYLQLFWKPDEISQKYFGTIKVDRKEVPERGDILSYDGKLLATSQSLYQVYMDCTVLQDHYARDKKHGQEKEEEWRNSAKVLGAQLAEIYGDHTADEYYRTIIAHRNGTMSGRKHVRIGTQIDWQTLQRVKQCELFKDGANRGGIQVDTIETRLYPYGSLGRRAIGQVRNNSEIANNLTGIEGKYNYVLHGKDGIRHLTRTDQRQNIQDYTRSSIPAENGADVRTTLNIEFQNIADKALRKVLEANAEIAGGCVMIMETSTGAIRAMANLRKDSHDNIGETFNYAITQSMNPGSVFKAATLMMLLDEGKVKSLDEMVPTFGGHWTYHGVPLPEDDYILSYKFPTGYISIGESLAISSNHVFRYLAAQAYDKNPDKFYSKLYEYKLLDKYDFDIEGLSTPFTLKPGDKGWSTTNLPSVAMGYSINVTPLHTLTFYNAIANNGKMMKPYMVEDIEKNGEVITQYGPKVLVGSVCKESTVKTLTEGLLMVTEHNGGDYRRGTGYTAFKGSKFRVAGKTGTSRVEFEYTGNDGKKHVGREDAYGQHVHQGTFVAFFPAEAPKYTVISVTYTKPTLANVYGAVSAKIVHEIADQLYLLSPEWGEPLVAQASVPVMEGGEPVANSRGEVPSVVGLGLGEAMSAIENCGYVCNYVGVGHVKSQVPAAFERLKPGSIVSIKLD